MSSFTGTSEIEEDPTIGEIKMYLKTWSGKDPLEWKELETKSCYSEDDFNNVPKDTDSEFFLTKED